VANGSSALAVDLDRRGAHTLHDGAR
jgi:hypothetical protein